MYNPFSLSGKTILVTGASSGIGRATAIECSKMGAVIVLTGRNHERLQETLALLEGNGHSLFTCDLTKEEEINNLAKELPTLNGVVLCAGISMLRPIAALNDDTLQTVFRTNCFAPMLLTRYLLKHKRMVTGASMVFVGSISGISNVATALSTYGASKSALMSFVKYAALELAGKKIRCNAVLPGRVETALLQNQTMNEDEVRQDIAKYPLKRYAQPHEVAQGIIYLLSDAADWVTGTSLTIDGGRSLI